MQETTKQNEIQDQGATRLSSQSGVIETLAIIGQIEGHQLLPETYKTTKYEHVLPLLTQAEEDESIDGLLLLLNTVGGDIEAGLAIAELIAGMRKPTVSLVLGGSHSIGVPLAVSAQTSFIVPSAGMTIHPVRMSGTVIGAPQTYDYFQGMQDRIVEFVARNSHISAERFTAYMMATGQLSNDVGTLIYGEEAVDCGLIDRIGSLSDALKCLHTKINRFRRRRTSRDPIQ